MGEHNRPVPCPFCRASHGRRFMCDPVAAMVRGMIQRGEGLSLPTLHLDEPLMMTPDPDADLIIGQLVAKAGTVPVPGGVYHPALVLTGMDAMGRTLPQWIYASDDEHLRLAAPLVHDMVELAIRRADAQNRGAA